MPSPSLLRIFSLFLRLGLTAFGGPAMVQYIRTMAVDREHWVSEESFQLGMGLTQILPGATAMQMAAYVGLRTHGGAGAIAAYLGFSLPAFLLMLGLSALYFTARGVEAVAAAFQGLQLVIVALALHAAVNFARQYLDSLSARLLACLAGIWLGLRGSPILSMTVVCILSIFLFRGEQGGAATGHGDADTKPLKFAGLLLAGLLVFMGALFLADAGLFDLGLLMIKIDCFAFGGGYVSVPLMLHEVVEVRHWLTASQFMDGIAMGQITPGPIVITSAFLGYALAGVVGALVAAVSIFSPSLIILCAATPFADRLISSPLIRRVLKGSLISLVGLMAAVAVRFGMNVEWDIYKAIFSLLAFAALRLGVDILWVVLAGAGVSILLF